MSPDWKGMWKNSHSLGSSAQALLAVMGGQMDARRLLAGVLLCSGGPAGGSAPERLVLTQWCPLSSACG